jgi:predicted MFS family arabinose efflux permease
VSAVVLAVLALTVVGGGSDPLLIALAGGVGLTFPPISSAMRVAWRATLDSELDRRAAYALDAVAVETIFVGGPLLLSLLTLTTPVVPLLVTAVFLGVGGVAYALTPAARAARGDDIERGAARAGGSPLTPPAVRVILGVALTMAVGFGLSDVSIAATAREVLGDTRWVGLLFAAIAGGSATGGLWYGSRHWHRPEEQRLPPPLAGFALGLAAVGALLLEGRPNPFALLPLMFVTGLCVAPTLIMLGNLVDHHAPPDRLSEAQAWLNTAFTSGGALGTAIAGVAVDTGGPARGFLVGAAAVVLSMWGGALVATRSRRAAGAG